MLRRTWNRTPSFDLLPGLLNPDECHRLIHLSQSLPASDARIDIGSDNVRRSTTYWINRRGNEVPWLTERLGQAVDAWNESNYRFDIDDCQDLQLTCYASGQHYDWHADLGKGESSRRKVSLVILLSARDEFTGGDLEFFSNTSQPARSTLGTGDGVIFPAWLKHRVLPVGSGTRWSLVSWWTGPPFR